MIISDEKAWDSYKNAQSCRGVIFLNPTHKHEKLTFNWLGLEVH
jgi:hypothetical protein